MLFSGVNVKEFISNLTVLELRLVGLKMYPLISSETAINPVFSTKLSVIYNPVCDDELNALYGLIK